MVAFFVLTFAFTWLAWIAAFALDGPLRNAVFLLGVFGPAIVALLLTARSGGGGAVRSLLRRMGRFRVAAGWYVFAVGYLIATKLFAAVVLRLATGTWPKFGDEPWWLMALGTVFSTLPQAGEEIGWRGYALPRLAERCGLGPASLVVGVLWAAWHLPLFFLPQADSYGQSFPVYLLHVTATSVAMAFLYWRTGGSLLLVMLMHAAVNNTTGIVPAAVPGASNPLSFQGSSVAWLTVIASWAIAAVLLWRMRGARSATDPTIGATRYVTQ
jgi:membrane protease YdiL (CAAX protease family)